ncbi:CapA family protein [Demequina globuliformis]|uniref:CapA family protein n=1 Tax=Demequina globuliformis TaxID=676202 RepID=UPI0009FD655A|nr:CapA family protein [Demequina globuliformis]
MLASPATNPRRRRWIAAAAAAVVGGACGVAVAALATQPDPTDLATSPSPTPSASAAASAPQPSPTPSPTPTTPTVEFTVVAGGDVLPHMPVVRSATHADGMDFSALMEGITPWVEGADLGLCHLEYPVDATGNFTGYPLFGGPAQLITDLREAGWDGCSTASNHSVDRAYAGLEATIDTLIDEGLGYAGTARTEDEAAQTQVYDVEADGRTVTVAHLSWTYGLNGLPKPEGMPWSVDTFDADAANAAPIIEAARGARDKGADVVIASVHCCVEYQTEPTPAQRDIAQQIADSGAVDLYVGHHAHVPQPLELLEGGPTGEGMWTAFGLGNFLSNQDSACCVPQTASSVLLSATISVAPDGATTVTTEWTPLTIDRRDAHTMHALTEIEQGAGTLTASEVATRYGLVADAVGTQATERTSPIGPLADAVSVRARSETAAEASPGASASASPSARP